MLTAKLNEFPLWEQGKRSVLHINQSHTVSFSYQILTFHLKDCSLMSSHWSFNFTKLILFYFYYFLVINVFNKIYLQVSYVVTRAFTFVNLQGSNFNWGHITCRPPRTDVLVKHSKDTMPHACSLRGHSCQPVPFVFTEYPHVARMYVMGHPGSHY